MFFRRCILLAGLCLTLPLGVFSQTFQSVSQLTGLSEEVATDVVVDAQGNRYACGFFGNTMNTAASVLTSQGSRDGYLVKYDAMGAAVWIQQLGSVLNDEAQVLGMDNQANLYLLLNHNDTLTVQGQEIFSTSYWSILKFDADGNLLLHVNPFVQLPTFFTLADMAVNETGEIVLTGEFGLSNTFNPAQLEFASETLFTVPRSNGTFAGQMWVARYDNQGQFLWARASVSTGIQGAFGRKVAINQASPRTT
jgi:hypothetical protein